MTETSQAVLFDFNGTINDMSVLMEQDIYVGKAAFGLTLTPQTVRDCWGIPAEEFYPKLFGGGGSHLSWQEMRKVFHSYNHLFPKRLLPGVQSTLAKLRQAGLVTGIVTSGLREQVTQAMYEGGLPYDAVDFVHTGAEISTDIQSGRPILRRALGECTLRDIAPSQIAFVGDEVVTIDDAAAIGARPILVSTGTTSRKELIYQGVPEKRIIDTLSELPAYLQLPT